MRVWSRWCMTRCTNTSVTCITCHDATWLTCPASKTPLRRGAPQGRVRVNPGLRLPKVQWSIRYFVHPLLATWDPGIELTPTPSAFNTKCKRVQNKGFKKECKMEYKAECFQVMVQVKTRWWGNYNLCEAELCADRNLQNLKFIWDPRLEGMCLFWGRGRVPLAGPLYLVVKLKLSKHFKCKFLFNCSRNCIPLRLSHFLSSQLLLNWKPYLCGNTCHSINTQRDFQLSTIHILNPIQKIKTQSIFFQQLVTSYKSVCEAETGACSKVAVQTPRHVPRHKCQSVQREACRDVPHVTRDLKCVHVPTQECRHVPVKLPVDVPQEKCYKVCFFSTYLFTYFFFRSHSDTVRQFPCLSRGWWWPQCPERSAVTETTARKQRKTILSQIYMSNNLMCKGAGHL